MSSQKIQEIFDRAMELLEKKLHTKVKTAILTVRTEDGIFEVSKGNTDSIVIMQIGSVQTKVANLLQKPLQANQIMNCSLCGGSGRDLEDPYDKCSVCLGGGEVILIEKGEKNGR